MDSKLEAYRAQKRRDATLNTIKTTLYNMIPFQYMNTDEKPSENPDDDKTTKTIRKTGPPAAEQASSSDDEVSAIPFTDSEEGDTPAAQTTAKLPAAEPRSMFSYFLYLVYFLFWATCWAISIQLQFGLVYLLLSGIFGVYFNTRTQPKAAKEVSAYSVFNKNCKSIDGTLNAEQFDREIRYGPANVR